MYIKPALKKNIYAAKLKNSEVVFGSKAFQEACWFSDINEIHKKVFQLLDGSLTISDLHKLLEVNGFDLSMEALHEFLDQLDELELIEENYIDKSSLSLSEYEMNRFNRQLHLFSTINNNGLEFSFQAQEKIRNAHVCIIGAGGTGSHFIYGLAAMGVENFTIVEFDKVEISNLSRQLFYDEDDIGKKKTNVLNEKCTKINKKASFTFIDKYIETEEDMAKAIPLNCTIAILCADTPRGKIQPLFNNVCVKMNIPFLNVAATSLDIATVGPLVIPGKTSCLNCSMSEEIEVINDEPYIESINNRLITMVIEPYNAIVANLGVLETMKHISNFSPCNLYNTIIQFNLNTFEINKIAIDKNEFCKVCGKHKTKV